jgi:hypothetical protein
MVIRRRFDSEPVISEGENLVYEIKKPKQFLKLKNFLVGPKICKTHFKKYFMTKQMKTPWVFLFLFLISILFHSPFY